MDYTDYITINSEYPSYITSASLGHIQQRLYFLSYNKELYDSGVF